MKNRTRKKPFKNRQEQQCGVSGSDVRGKIIKGIAGFYYVHTPDDHIYQCKAKGIFRNINQKPLVGDNVDITIVDHEAEEGNIIRILPRMNNLIRPAVANVDQVLVMFAAIQPEPNMNLLDRFLVMMGREEIPVSIVFNKADLADEKLVGNLRSIYHDTGIPTFFISTRYSSSIDDIRELIRGKTTVLAGPSGVGKSSLTNLLQPMANMQTGMLSEKIKRGKHTTRHSELFFIEENTYLMDTPGFSSMNVSDIELTELKNYFYEFTRYEQDCKFLGCVHIGEKICGVKSALENHKISQSRYENYCLIYREIKEKRKY